MVKDDVKMLRDGGNYLFIYLYQAMGVHQEDVDG